MQKQLSGGVVTGILIVVGIVVAVLAWKALAPPAAPGAAQITKAQMEAHNSSAAAIADDQKRRFEASQGKQ